MSKFLAQAAVITLVLLGACVLALGDHLSAVCLVGAAILVACSPEGRQS